MHTILIVEDDGFLRKATQKKLVSEGYEAIEASNKSELFKRLEKHSPHLILLDVMLDEDNGIELIKEIKGYTEAPIVILSSKDHLFDKVIALEMGADDYICKPAAPQELLSRIKANIRRYINGNNVKADKRADSTNKLQLGSWIADHTTYSVKDEDGRDAGLTKDEFDLLVTLAGSPNVIFSRDRLFEILKADNYDSFDRAIDIQIARIRSKLGDDARNPSIIKTVRKLGYQFIAPVKKL